MNISKFKKQLGNFQKPGRYLGSEKNSYVPKKGKLKFLLCFPDDYTIGMSSLGFHTVGNIVDKEASYSCERCFAPWPDMEEWLRKSNTGLFSLESKTEVSRFDIVAFSLQYELSLTNMVNMLDLSGINPFRLKRKNGPLIMGGGPVCSNPAILEEILDVIVIGDAEASLPCILKEYRKNKEKSVFLSRVKNIKGVYVPGHSDRVSPAVCEKLDNKYFPKSPPVSLIDIPHNRINIEINRGCRNRCSFCRASAVYSPYREKKTDDILDAASGCISSTGYDEVALTSLSGTDHSRLIDVMDDIHYAFRDLGVSVVMSSMRPAHFLGPLSEKMARMRKGGITFAPETPSERLKKVINKRVSNRQILDAAKIASSKGWRKMKLYFMVGLPGEKEEDIEEIPRFVRKIKKESGLMISVSVKPMIPQPETPFQWLENSDIEDLNRKVRFIAKKTPARISGFNPQQHIVESILARGDSSVAGILVAAQKEGARFDQWSEHFNFNLWEKAFNNKNSSWQEYYYRDFRENARFPWDVVKRSRKEKNRMIYEKAIEEAGV